jgi:endonuclease/exonuclease/phosphatase family metal-dependent hydrolase
MRIATWNLRFNHAASQWPGLWNRLGLDLLFLQESERPETGHACHWESVPGNAWGSAIILRSGRIEPVPVPNFEGWVVGGEAIDSGLPAGGKRLFVFSLHSPSPSTAVARKSYIKEVDAVISQVQAAVPPGSEILIGGDFNFTIGERQLGEFQETTIAEREVIQRMAELGLSSCWSMSHPDLPLEQTLRWMSDPAPHKATPFHCDGIFVPHRWTERTSCEVFTSVCYRISDHNPVVAWIDE